MVKLHLQDIIIEPMMTEKATYLAGKSQFAFKVHPQANKPMVVNALEKIFNVKVKDISILNQKGKKKTTRKRNVVSYTPRVKKAIVTLREGSFPFLETLN